MKTERDPVPARAATPDRKCMMTTRQLGAGTKKAENAGAPRVEGELVEGDAGQALLSVAQNRSADLIVVGNRGINTLSGRLVVGSVPSDVSHRARCDMLIVRAAEGGKA